VEKQNETVSERKHGIHGSTGETDSLFSSEGFSSGSFEKSDGRTSEPGERKAVFLDQAFSGGHRFHIE
jgi:hypothetical protein